MSPDDIVKFNKLADEAMTIPINDINYAYVLSVFGFHNDPEWPFQVPASQREARLKKIQELGLRVTQRWYESKTNPKAIKDRFHSIVNKFVKQFYPEVTDNYSNVHHQDAFSIYLKGDHTDVHRDGQNQGRMCVVLAYLTPEEEYNNSGDLIILGDEQPADPNECAVKVKPIRGNVAMLDFNNHNPFHGVLPVNPEFIRHCYITFIWNIDRMPKNLRPEGYS
jgi:Rps23 Pro-64 3,4-dihydroxylase Tpa1-like proline 4-hydroxylase